MKCTNNSAWHIIGICVRLNAEIAPVFRFSVWLCNFFPSRSGVYFPPLESCLVPQRAILKGDISDQASNNPACSVLSLEFLLPSSKSAWSVLEGNAIPHGVKPSHRPTSPLPIHHKNEWVQLRLAELGLDHGTSQLSLESLFRFGKIIGCLF